MIQEMLLKNEYQFLVKLYVIKLMI